MGRSRRVIERPIAAILPSFEADRDKLNHLNETSLELEESSPSQKEILQGGDYLCSSWKETMNLGKKLGSQAKKKGALFCLFGELGAGKTTLIKGIAEGALGIDSSLVSSPTFLYLNIYSHPETTRRLYHFDLYRLKGPDDFLESGFDEYLALPNLVCIEWSERIQSLLPPHAIALFLTHLGTKTRHIRIKPWES